MARETIKKGLTSVIREFTLRDATTGQPQTGIAYGSVTIKYTRAGDSSETTVTAVSGTLGTWTSSGWAEYSGTGKYQFGIPNAAVATGVDCVSITIAASGCITKEITIQLSGVDMQDAVRQGMTALPNAAASTVGGLPLAVDTSGRVDVLKINGTSQTARNLGNALSAAAPGAQDGLVINGANTGTMTLGTLGISGPVTLSSTLSVTGLVTYGSLTVTGPMAVGGAFTVTGETTLHGSLVSADAWAGLSEAGEAFGADGGFNVVTIASTAYAAIRAAVGMSAANLDTTLAALATAIANINNLSALANLSMTQVFELPDTGSVAYPIRLKIHDTEGNLIDLDASPTITATGGASNDRSANLSAITHTATGVYDLTYTLTAGDAKEPLRISAAGTSGGEARRADSYATIADADSATAIASILTKLGTPTTSIAGDIAAVQTAVDDKTGYALTSAYDPAKSAAQAGDAMTLTSDYDSAMTAASATSVAAITTILSGITSLAKWLRAFVRKDTPDSTALSEINNTGGGYDATTDSQQAISDQGGGSAPSVDDIAGRLLASPDNKILTDSSGYVTATNGSGATVDLETNATFVRTK